MKTNDHFCFWSFCVLLIVITQNEAANWNQFRSNSPNNGFAAVQTSAAVEPFWSLEVGTINGVCPAIGPDDTVYVANRRGTLMAINPNGTLKWQRELRRGWACSTPSIGSDGRIYVGCTHSGYIRDHRNGQTTRRFIQQSQLFCCDPDTGQIRWRYTPPQIRLSTGELKDFFFTSPPKVWSYAGSQYIFLVEAYWDEFVMQQNFLIVLDSNGNLIDARYLSEAAFASVTGGGGFRDAEIGPKPLPAKSREPENSIAIADFGSYSENPLIVVIDEADALTAFEWRVDRLSSPIWTRPPSNATFDHFVTSPCIFFNGLLFFGRSDGRIFLLNPKNGAELNKPWPTFDAGVYSAAASFLRQMYFITLDGEMVALDGDGQIWKTLHLGAQSTSSPAMTASFIYVNAADGLYTLSFDLEKVAYYEFMRGGNSSPVIGNNGTVYSLGLNTLYAFPRN